MKRTSRNCLVMCLSAMLLAIAGRAQSVFPNLPAITPAYSNDFNQTPDIPQPSLSDCILDKKGRLWVATTPVLAGINLVRLFQFDGYHYYPVNLANDQSTARTVAILRYCLPDGNILGFFESVTANDIFRFDPETQNTRLLSFDIAREGKVEDVRIDGQGNPVALLLGPDSLFLYRIRDFQQKELLMGWKNPGRCHPTDTRPTYGYSLYLDGDEAWVSQNCNPGYFHLDLLKQQCRYDPAGTPVSFSVPQEQTSVIDSYCNGFARAKNGDVLSLILESPHQVMIRKANTGAFMPFSGIPPGYRVRRIQSDSAGNVLFLLLDKQFKNAALLLGADGRWYDYSAFVSQHVVVHNIRSANFFISVWLCTSEGLFHKVAQNKGFIECMLAGMSVRSMTEFSPGHFLFTTDNNSKALIYESADGKLSDGPDVSALTSAFAAGTVRNLQHAPDGSIWGNKGDTLVQYFPASHSYRKHGMFFQLLYEYLLRDGRIAVFSRTQGLQFYEPASGRITDWNSTHGLKGEGAFIHQIQQTNDGILWVLTSCGLYKLDLKTGNETVLGFGATFHDFRFVCMLQMDDGKLWLGTFLGGIHIYDPASGAVQIIGREQGMPSNTVVQLLQDANGFVWAGTYKGLVRLSPEGVIQNTYSLKEGLCELEFNRYAAMRAQDGALYMGTVNGLHIIRPQAIEGMEKLSRPPLIYLTSLAVADPATGGEIIFQKSLEQLPLIQLPPERRFLHVSFALSNYTQTGRNHFAYMLQGLDKKWTYIGDQHELVLNDLPAGRYTLVIKGCDFEGNWTTRPVFIEIYARDFFYRQWWFYLICALPFAAFLLLWLRRLRSEKKRLEAEVEKRTQQIRQDKALIERQAQDLLRLDEAKSRFFTNISHELRTPITLITAPVERLIDKYHPQLDDEGSALRAVLFNGRKLGALVEELLELSRLEAGKTELITTPTEFFPWCRQLVSAFDSQAQMKRMRYVFDYQADQNLSVAVDRKRLEKIINNLIANALKFTPPEGEVWVTVSEESMNVADQILLRIRVSDTGRGIPEEDISHVFERYFQTNRNDLAKEGGTGIGLALSRELAQLMNGSLSVESRWGQGSAFTLTLPLAITGKAEPFVADTQHQVSETVPEPPDEKIPAVNGQTHREKILIAEDNPDMQALLKTLLADTYDLHIASDGQEAWEYLTSDETRQAPPSLVLSDVMMPRLDGYELLGRLKAAEHWRHTPVIMLTARADQEDKLQALNMGVDDYLVKPFSPQELTVRVANLIANYNNRLNFQQNHVVDIAFEPVEGQDQAWLKTIESAAKNALDKGRPLQIIQLAEAGNVSERQLFREIKRLTGLTPNQYIQEVRLQKARHLLQHGAFNTLAEVAYAVGFETPSYFTKIFEAHFGKHPSGYFQQENVRD